VYGHVVASWQLSHGNRTCNSVSERTEHLFHLRGDPAVDRSIKSPKAYTPIVVASIGWVLRRRYW
jgi:hypothetical protein